MEQETYDWLNKQDFYKFEPVWALHEHAQGIYGFTVLGTNALSALPALERMLWDTNTSWAAAKALEQLGLAALPLLRAGLVQTNPFIRQAALAGTMSTNLAVATLPEVWPLRHDPDWLVSLIALRRLMQFASRDEATQLGIEALQGNDFRQRRVAMHALALVSIETSRVVRVLIPLLEGPDPRLRKLATNTLRQLDPEAAAAAGIDTNPPSVANRPLGGRGSGRGPATTNTTNSPRPVDGG